MLVKETLRQRRTGKQKSKNPVLIQVLVYINVYSRGRRARMLSIQIWCPIRMTLVCMTKKEGKMSTDTAVTKMPRAK